MNYFRVLNQFYPNMNFFCKDTYESLEWREKEIPKPTKEELCELYESVKNEWAMCKLRNERDALLKESDIYALSDYPHKSQEIKDKWVSYRQALRDSTKDKILPSKPT
jgi:hypothetical protein